MHPRVHILVVDHVPARARRLADALRAHAPTWTASVASSLSAGAEPGGVDVCVASSTCLGDGSAALPPTAWVVLLDDPAHELALREAGVDASWLPTDPTTPLEQLLPWRVRDALARRADRDTLRSATPRAEEFGALIAQTPTPVAYWSRDLVCEIANPPYCQLLGQTAEALIGHHIDDVAGPLRTRNADEIDAVLRGVPQHFERTLPALRGGIERTVIGSYVPDVREGAVVGFFVLAVDVSARQQLEDSLRAAERRWATLFSILPVGVSVVDAAGQVQAANPALERILGLDAAALKRGDHHGRAYLDLHGDRMSPAQLPTARARADGASAREVGVVREDGTVVWTEVIAAAVPEAPGTVVAVTADVTARKEAEIALTRDAARLDAVLGAMVDALITIGPDNEIVLVNPAVTRMFGYTREEMVGKNIALLMPADVAAAHDGHVRRYEQTRASRAIGGSRDVTGRRKDGTLFDLQLSVAELPAEAESGRYIGTLHDLTRQRAEAAERQALEDHLVESRRLHAIGRLAGGVAHDFNNLLTVISGTAGLLRDDAERRGTPTDEIDDIAYAAARGAELTRQLLAFSQPELVTRSTVDLATVLTRLEPMLRRLLPEHISLVVRATGPLPVTCELASLDQVVLNLAINARDAMPDGGTLEIAARRVDLDARSTAANPGLAAGTHAELTVSDEGVGMSETTRERIFEPFFTTKRPGQGTGLGLATVYGIVRDAGGALSVSSAVGAGTLMRVWLPLGASADAAVAARKDETPVERATVLVVEDDPPIRRLVTRVLKRVGYEVLDTATAEAALECLRHHPGRVDLLFTDLVLPGMSGAELARQVQAIRPGIRVLFTSGYADDPAVADADRSPRATILAKPYPIDALTAAIQQTLAPEPTSRPGGTR